MRKRIHLHQLRAGMFVGELEAASGHGTSAMASIAVKADADVRRLSRSGAMSLIIDTEKGVDVAGGAPASSPTVHQRFYDDLLSRYSSEEIALARKAIDETMPHIRSVLGEARLNSTFRMDAAGNAVEHIMSAALQNAGAFITPFEASHQERIYVSALSGGQRPNDHFWPDAGLIRGHCTDIGIGRSYTRYRENADPAGNYPKARQVDRRRDVDHPFASDTRL